MKRIFAIVMTCLVLAAAAMPSAAQEQSPQGFGVGVETAQSIGVMPYWTFSSMFQAALGIGLLLESNNNAFLLYPQARLMFPIIATYYLFLDAQLRFIFQNENYIALNTRIGLFSMITKTIGLYAGIAFLEFQFNPTERTQIGLLSPVVGAQFAIPTN